MNTLTEEKKNAHTIILCEKRAKKECQSVNKQTKTFAKL